MSDNQDMQQTHSRPWPSGISAITLLVDDLATATAFYRRVFDLPVHYADAHSTVFDFGNILVNLLDTREASDLIDPAPVAPADAGSRVQLTITVVDVDALCARLAGLGVHLLNGPMDRPWGIRTASFIDPGGHIWEVAQPITAS
jgi:catechol 2,3-dioxygenase-like lactoylglutathione lyase family enzyme